jgi:UDP-N-acetylglucosamine--N-acetylmuramyl-(pentapeptide) pyrophosphoryl-undecaprenol N-acetylglucosamine transferase
MDEDETRLTRLQREVHRLRISPSLRLGSHLTDAIRKPWRAPFLILTLPWMMLMIGFELLGWKSQPAAFSTNTSGRLSSKGNCVVMFPTNGVGFGHFTRLLAVAKRMKKLDPELEIIFFTTMPTLHLLKPYGIPAHHISGPKYFKGMSSEEWNALLEEELSVCFETHRPSMFLFDGAFPYRGMLRAIQGRNSIQKMWMRRGTFRKGSSIPVDSIEYFDAVIHPEDSITAVVEKAEHNVEIMTCPPIVMLDSEELLSKQKARSRLGLPQDSVVVYVQLGAGEINDIESEIRLTLESLLENPAVYVVLGESLIGEKIDVDLPRVQILRDYPNSMYFRGFDATVQAGGYNSFHETRTFGLPTLFYPNMNTGMDDQLARCKVAEEEGWGIVLDTRNKDAIVESCALLIRLIDTARKVETSNGAISLSKKLLEVIGNAS